MSIGNLTSIATKGIGLVGLGAITYDAHRLGKIKSSEYRKSCTSKSLLDSFTNTGANKNPSSITAKIKNAFFNYKINNQGINAVKGFFNSIVGYVKGFGTMLVSDTIPLVLSAATVITKGLPSKISAGALLAYSAVRTAKEVLFSHRDI